MINVVLVEPEIPANTFFASSTPSGTVVFIFQLPATIFVLMINTELVLYGAKIRRSREQCKFICIGQFRPERQGDIGLPDTTDGTGDASLTACIAEA